MVQGVHTRVIENFDKPAQGVHKNTVLSSGGAFQVGIPESTKLRRIVQFWTEQS
jgi:hypothetical protein